MNPSPATIMNANATTGRGSTGNVLAGVVWLITFGWGGWIMHIWSCYEAATYKGRQLES